MSNRLLGFLVLFAIGGAVYAFYMYFFVYNLVTLQITSNVPAYTIVLSSSKLPDITSECAESQCEIQKLAPFTYDIVGEKEGYKDVSFTMNLSDGYVKNIKFEKDPIFRETLDIVSLSEDIVGSGNNTTVSHNYRYSNGAITRLNSSFFRKIPINMEIKYLKTGANKHEFLIVTEKGTFIFDSKSNNLRFLSIVKDFVYYNDSYIALIDYDDTRIKKNLGFDDVDGNLIVQIDPTTREKKILHITSLTLDKIYSGQDGVILINPEGKIYELTNF